MTRSDFKGKKFLVHHYQRNPKKNNRLEFYTDFFHFYRPYWLPDGVSMPSSFTGEDKNPIDIVYRRKDRRIIVINGQVVGRFSTLSN